MIIRPTTPEENARAAELFAIDFRMAMAPGTVAPGGEPGKRRWGAFDEAGEMMCSMLVTDCTVHFDGSRSPMAAFGGVNTLPPYRRRGCIRRCFEEILPQLHAEGCELSYLYTFSTSYYLQFGYSLLLSVLNPLIIPDFVGISLVICAIIWIMVVTWLFPLQSRFVNTWGRMIMNSLICALRFFPHTIAMSVLNLIPWIILIFAPASFLKWGILWLLLWFGLAAYWNICLLDTPLRLLTESALPADADQVSGETPSEE